MFSVSTSEAEGVCVLSAYCAEASCANLSEEAACVLSARDDDAAAACVNVPETVSGLCHNTIAISSNSLLYAACEAVAVSLLSVSDEVLLFSASDEADLFSARSAPEEGVCVLSARDIPAAACVFSARDDAAAVCANVPEAEEAVSSLGHALV